MKTRVRALERQLVRERMQVALEQVAHDYVGRCYAAEARDQPLPDHWQLARAVHAAGFNPPSLAAAMNYVQKQTSKGAIPDPQLITKTLLADDEHHLRHFGTK
jgi:hypothetical protein